MPPRFPNVLTWSKSRDGLFRSCKRAYYLNHYGSWGGWEKDAPEDVRTLYIMKNLDSIPTWIGTAVHDVCERAMKAIQRGREIPMDLALADLKHRMNAQAKESLAGKVRQDPKRKLGLMGHFYGQGIDESDLEDAIEQAIACARIFYEGKVYGRVKYLGKDAILEVEELDGFEVDGVKVWVKLDLAMRGKDGEVVIVDWKTGKNHEAKEIDLQLGIYGLYGTSAFKASPDKIKGFDVNLRDGALSTHPINPEVLDTVLAYIKESIGEMQSYLDDVPENIASQERFPMTDELWRCRRCNFRGACGREDV